MTGKVDNEAIQVNNDEQVENVNTISDAVAEVSASEDTTATNWQEIVEVKDGIISAYESQVSSLKNQLATLIRNGAFVQEPTEQTQANQANAGIGNQLGGFGHDANSMESYSVADLGKEIGKRD